MKKLIAFEGIDGVGKTTQIKLLKKYLKKYSIKHKIISFPRYNSLYGKRIKKYLHNDDFNLDIYSISMLYALDRYDAKEKILKLLQDNYLVILDRYFYSNLAHQKTSLTKKEANKYENWLLDLELKKNSLPVPEKTIILDTPVNIALKRINDPDKLEKKKKLKKARHAYLNMKNNTTPFDIGNIKIIKGEGSKKEVQNSVFEELKQRLISKKNVKSLY